MKALLACAVAALLPQLMTTPLAGQALEAEARGSAEPSGFWDWIHKLSGPQYMGGGISYACGLPCKYGNPFRRRGREEREPNTRLRVSVGIYSALDDDDVNPTDADLKLNVYQLAVEQRILGLGNLGRFELGAGLAASRFYGDHDSFWRGSLIVYPQVRFTRVGPFVFTAGQGRRIFQSFGDDAFEPLNITLDRDGVDAVWITFLNVAFHLQ